jgi:ATP-dependent DNA ligase
VKKSEINRNELFDDRIGRRTHRLVFDVMVQAGKDVMREPLDVRRTLLEKHVLPKHLMLGQNGFGYDCPETAQA